jgi:hypothetical protein
MRIQPQASATIRSSRGSRTLDAATSDEEAQAVVAQAAALVSPVRTSGALIAFDAIAVALASVVTLTLGDGGPPELRLYSFLGLGVLGTFGLVGLYPAAGLDPAEEFRRATLGLTALFVSTGAVVAATGGRSPSWSILLLAGFVLILVPLGRALARELFARSGWWGVPVVVLGAGRAAEAVIQRLHEHRRLGMTPIACLDDDPSKAGESIHGVPVTGSLNDARLFRRRGVRHALVAMSSSESRGLGPLQRRFGHVIPTVVAMPTRFGVASLDLRSHELGGGPGPLVTNKLRKRAHSRRQGGARPRHRGAGTADRHPDHGAGCSRRDDHLAWQPVLRSRARWSAVAAPSGCGSCEPCT